MNTNSPKRFLSALLPTIAAGLLLTAMGATPAFATELDDAPAAAPQLSITISDDRDETDAADSLNYTIVIENLGTTDALGLVVTQSVPDGMTFGSADSSGALADSAVSWTLDIKAAATASLTTTMTVGETPRELLRLATVACAQSTPTDPPLVCASDSDLLLAGAAVAVQAAPTSGPDAMVWWIVGGSTTAVMLGVVGAFLLFRRRRPGTEHRRMT